MDDNRRYEYRIMADLVVEDLATESSAPEKIQGSIRELSASGCRLESSADLQVGQSVRISFQLAGEQQIQDAKARIVRRLSQRTHKVVAVEFVNLSDEDQFKIREFVVWKEAQEA